MFLCADLLDDMYFVNSDYNGRKDERNLAEAYGRFVLVCKETNLISVHFKSDASF